ncbi:MAG: aminotransferase class IV [Deltaproteobacteria bacterium]|jgi:branched-chain amino acid aminotransferase|nr:aminotransferase class IV [Deltaproteobacteria bacterium]
MATKWPHFTPQDFVQKLSSFRRDFHKNYFVMFSSTWQGFSTDPELWGIPPDDHMAHRGDGVFESFKCVNSRVYCLNEHLTRLQNSASFLGIDIPLVFYETLDILKEAYRLGGQKDFVIRLCISRGRGSFSVNPYDTQGSEYYLVTVRLSRPSPEKYSEGVKIITAPFPAKQEFSEIKSCDYLHNVLVKKAGLDAGADYAVSFDKDGFLTEGPTENILILTKDKELLAPPWNRILRGITLSRVLAKGEELVQKGLIRAVRNQDIHRKDLFQNLEEAFLTSTSFDLLPITIWDGQKVGDGTPGPIGKELLRLIDDEVHGENTFTTSLIETPK